MHLCLKVQDLFILWLRPWTIIKLKKSSSPLNSHILIRYLIETYMMDSHHFGDHDFIAWEFYFIKVPQMKWPEMTNWLIVYLNHFQLQNSSFCGIVLSKKQPYTPNKKKLFTIIILCAVNNNKKPRWNQSIAVKV